MNFNDRLVELRRRRGLSQEQLGYELGVSRQTVSNWELGQSYPDFQRLVLLSDYYEMSLDELVRGVDVGDVRALNESEKQISSIYSDVERGKEAALRAWRAFLVVGCVVLALFELCLTARSEHPSRRAISLTGSCATACMRRRRSCTAGSWAKAATSSPLRHLLRRSNPGSDFGPADGTNESIASRLSVCLAFLRSIRHVSRCISLRALATSSVTSTETLAPPGKATVTEAPHAPRRTESWECSIVPLFL